MQCTMRSIIIVQCTILRCDRTGVALVVLVAYFFAGRADHHQTIRARLGTPDLARTPVELTHRSVRLVARETLEHIAKGPACIAANLESHCEQKKATPPFRALGSRMSAKRQ